MRKKIVIYKDMRVYRHMIRRRRQNKQSMLLLSFVGAAFLFSPVALAIHKIPAPSQMEVSALLAKQDEVASYDALRSAHVKGFVQSMGDEVTGHINDAKLAGTQENIKLKNVLNKNFDMHAISRFTLGINWKNLTAMQQEEYRALFEDMIVSLYANKLSYYQGQSFKVINIQHTGGSDFTVMSRIQPQTGKNISVKWRVRVQDDKYRIIDVAIEDVSMLITQRSNFSNTIQRNGGNAAAILDYLRSKKTYRI